MLFRCRSLTSDIYSTLVKLKIKVFSLYDCIYVLDAPFERLQTLIVDVERFFRTGTSHESLVSRFVYLKQIQILDFYVENNSKSEMFFIELF